MSQLFPISGLRKAVELVQVLGSLHPHERPAWNSWLQPGSALRYTKKPSYLHLLKVSKEWIWALPYTIHKRLNAPLLIKLPANVSEKQQRMPQVLSPYTHTEDPDDAPGFRAACCCSYLGNEPVDASSLHLFLCNTAFQLNKLFFLITNHYNNTHIFVFIYDSWLIITSIISRRNRKMLEHLKLRKQVLFLTLFPPFICSFSSQGSPRKLEFLSSRMSQKR